MLFQKYSVQQKISANSALVQDEFGMQGLLIGKKHEGSVKHVVHICYKRTHIVEIFCKKKSISLIHQLERQGKLDTIPSKSQYDEDTYIYRWTLQPRTARKLENEDVPLTIILQHSGSE